MAIEDPKVELKPEDVQREGQEAKKTEGKEEAPLYSDMGNMGKFIEQMKMGEESAKEEPKPESKPCVGCPDEDALAKFTKEDGTKAIDIIEVDGRNHPIYTRDDYVTLAKSTAKEAEQKPGESMAQYEERLAQVSGPLNELVKLMKQGKPLPTAKQEAEEEELTDLDTLDDGIRNVFMKQKDTIGSLKAELEGLKGQVAVHTDNANRQSIERTAKRMDEEFAEIKKEFPFDEIMAKDGTNITQNEYAGLVSVHANLDRMQAAKDPGFKPRNMPELMRATASDMKAKEDYYRKKFSGSEDGGNPSGEMTAEMLIEKYPEIANEVGKIAIVKYMKEAKEGTDPEVRSTNREASPTERKTNKDFKSIDDAFDAAFKDEEVVKGLEEISQRNRSGLL